LIERKKTLSIKYLDASSGLGKKPAGRPRNRLTAGGRIRSFRATLKHNLQALGHSAAVPPSKS
jgi:hypothetical protein